MSGLPATPAVWDRDRDAWIVTSQSPLSDDQLRRIGAWLLPVQRQRRLGLGPGDRRDDLDLAISALERGRVLCGLRDRGAGVTPFQSTERTGRIISLGAH